MPPAREPNDASGDAAPNEARHGETHRAEDVRGGEIILRTRTRRLTFLAGLIGIILIAVALRLAAVV